MIQYKEDESTAATRTTEFIIQHCNAVQNIDELHITNQDYKNLLDSLSSEKNEEILIGLDFLLKLLDNDYLQIESIVTPEIVIYMMNFILAPDLAQKTFQCFTFLTNVIPEVSHLLIQEGLIEMVEGLFQSFDLTTLDCYLELLRNIIIDVPVLPSKFEKNHFYEILIANGLSETKTFLSFVNATLNSDISEDLFNFLIRFVFEQFKLKKSEENIIKKLLKIIIVGLNSDHYGIIIHLWTISDFTNILLENIDKFNTILKLCVIKIGLLKSDLIWPQLVANNIENCLIDALMNAPENVQIETIKILLALYSKCIDIPIDMFNNYDLLVYFQNSSYRIKAQMLDFFVFYFDRMNILDFYSHITMEFVESILCMAETPIVNERSALYHLIGYIFIKLCHDAEKIEGLYQLMSQYNIFQLAEIDMNSLDKELQMMSSEIVRINDLYTMHFGQSQIYQKRV